LASGFSSRYIPVTGGWGVCVPCHGRMPRRSESTSMENGGAFFSLCVCGGSFYWHLRREPNQLTNDQTSVASGIKTIALSTGGSAKETLLEAEGSLLSLSLSLSRFLCVSCAAVLLPRLLVSRQRAGRPAA